MIDEMKNSLAEEASFSSTRAHCVEFVTYQSVVERPANARWAQLERRMTRHAQRYHSIYFHATSCNSSASSTRRSLHAGMRRGLTLVEMMVSVTITLLVVFAIVQVFDIMGSTIAMGRATIEMAGQLRNVTNILQEDLDNLTCPVEPWIDPDAGVGYFEYIEGPLEVRLTATDPRPSVRQIKIHWQFLAIQVNSILPARRQRFTARTISRVLETSMISSR